MAAISCHVARPQRAVAGSVRGAGKGGSNKPPATCPAGSGKAKTANTVCPKGHRHLLEEGEEESAGRSLLGRDDCKCCPCKSGFRFAPFPRPVNSAFCSKCPTGSTANGFNCAVAPGSYLDISCKPKPCVKTCPADFYCLGGNIAGTSVTNPLGPGANKTACPPGTTTNGVTGATNVSACGGAQAVIPFTVYVTPTLFGNNCSAVLAANLTAAGSPFKAFFDNLFAQFGNITLDPVTLKDCTESTFLLQAVQFKISGKLTAFPGVTSAQVLFFASQVGIVTGANLCKVVVDNSAPATCKDIPAAPFRILLELPPPPTFTFPSLLPFTLIINSVPAVTQGSCLPDTIKLTPDFLGIIGPAFLSVPFFISQNQLVPTPAASASIIFDLSRTCGTNQLTYTGTILPFDYDAYLTTSNNILATNINEVLTIAGGELCNVDGVNTQFRCSNLFITSITATVGAQG